MHPILAYRFRIRLLDSKPNTVIRAQQVSGLKLALKHHEKKTVEGVKEMPLAVNFQNLIISRAIIEESQSSPWDISTLIRELHIQRFNMGIHLLDAKNKYIRSWNVIGAYPTSWESGDVNASSSSVLIEKIEFKYHHIRFIRQTVR